MNLYRHLGLILAFGLVSPVWAQFPMNQEEQVALRIVQTDDAQFPLALRNTTVMNGEARIAINVDGEGKLVECLVTGYSRQEFADAAVAALRRWSYVPARLNGETWPSVQVVSFDFSRTGVVVSLTVTDVLNMLSNQVTEGKYAYRVHTLRELDRIPTPIEVVSPSPPALDPKEGKRTVLVDFYIDEEGRVRMPSVARAEANDACAGSAMAAVKQWRFEPPLCHGEPVLVHAQQPFNFVPKA